MHIHVRKKNMLDQHGMKPAGDILSFGVILGSLAEYLPAIAALASIIWSAIRIYETETVQKFLGRDKKS